MHTYKWKMKQSQGICKIFNVTFLESINKLLLEKNLVYSQNQKDSFVLLEITETGLK
jgi:hypothetical protein